MNDFQPLTSAGHNSTGHPPAIRLGDGLILWSGLLGLSAQTRLMACINDIWSVAPPRHPVTRWGKPMSVAISAAGASGWTAGRSGYRYVPTQEDGRPWPPIPSVLFDLWRDLLPDAPLPDSLLVNLYRQNARMGLHQDHDEADLTQPVLSISLGDSALFRHGGTERSAPTKSVWLASGDVLAMGGASRLIFHGIDRIRAGSSTLVPGGGRVNLTLRVAGSPTG